MPNTRRPQIPTRVVAPGAGVSIRTRLRLDPAERALLEAIGAHLTRARNTDLAAAPQGEKVNDRRLRAAITAVLAHATATGATADATEAQTGLDVHEPPAQVRQPSRRPPRSSGVVRPGELSEQVDAGHWFPGDPPNG